MEDTLTSLSGVNTSMTNPRPLMLEPSNFAWWDDRVFQKEPIDIQMWVNAESPPLGTATLSTIVNLLTVPQSNYFVCQKIGIMTQQLAVPSDVLYIVQGHNNAGLAQQGNLSADLLLSDVLNATYCLSPFSWLCGVPWVDFYKILNENVQVRIRVNNNFQPHDALDYSGDIVCNVRLTGWMVKSLGSSWPRAGLVG